jgi:hypothetical protein
VGKIVFRRVRFETNASGDFAHAVVSFRVFGVGKIAAGSAASNHPRHSNFAHPTLLQAYQNPV